MKFVGVIEIEICIKLDIPEKDIKTSASKLMLMTKLARLFFITTRKKNDIAKIASIDRGCFAAVSLDC